MLNMADSKIMEICEKAPKGQILKSLAAAHSAEEKAKESKPAASARPAPAAPAAPARSAAPAPAATTAPTVTAHSLACAMLDEQERRAAAAMVKTREQFNAMTPRQQSDFCKSGGKITA